MRLTLAEIRACAEDAEKDDGVVELPYEVVFGLLTSFVQSGAGDDYEVGE
jgi:hypothetical protein